ncbi:MAG: hypothetical protein EBS91_08965, partial [Betaproteobacteria bacterium]|nr:hypothetical protein [Betaproteobacteria bacterium]
GFSIPHGELMLPFRPRASSQPWLKNDRSRPLLQTANPRGRLAQLYRERDVWYREVADLVVETGRQSASKLARQIGQQIRPNPEPAAEVTACNP